MICPKCGKHIPQQYKKAHDRWEKSDKTHPAPDANHKKLHRMLRKMKASKK